MAQDGRDFLKSRLEITDYMPLYQGGFLGSGEIFLRFHLADATLGTLMDILSSAFGENNGEREAACSFLPRPRFDPQSTNKE